MAVPLLLSSLTAREATQDALYRALLAFDTANVSMLESAFTDDAIFDLGGTELKGLDMIKTDCYNSIAKLDTTHFITNFRVDIKDGASTAVATASGLAQHYRQGEGMKPGTSHYMSGSLYELDLVKNDRDEMWKIKVLKLKFIWFDGDFGVISGQ